MPRKPRPRRPKNSNEAKLFDHLTASGWEVWKRGFPTFVCFHPEKGPIFVEVKRRKSRKPKWIQRRLFGALARAGFPVYVWTPGGGFQAFLPGDAEP